MVVSYSRSTLGQSGDGHFSPIGCCWSCFYVLVISVVVFIVDVVVFVVVLFAEEVGEKLDRKWRKGRKEGEGRTARVTKKDYQQA